jgi:hypothetical protein
MLKRGAAVKERREGDVARGDVDKEGRWVACETRILGGLSSCGYIRSPSRCADERRVQRAGVVGDVGVDVDVEDSAAKPKTGA